MKESTHSMFHLRDTFIIVGALSCNEIFFHTLIKMWHPYLEWQCGRYSGMYMYAHKDSRSAQQVNVGYGCDHYIFIS